MKAIERARKVVLALGMVGQGEHAAAVIAETIRQAVAERQETCAKVADKAAMYGEWGSTWGPAIAAAIRALEDE